MLLERGKVETDLNQDLNLSYKLDSTTRNSKLLDKPSIDEIFLNSKIGTPSNGK